MSYSYRLRTLVTALAAILVLPAVIHAQDVYEPDNTIGQASNIIANESQYHLFTNEWDVDWIQFTTTVNRAYQIGMTNIVAGNIWGTFNLYGPATNLMESISLSFQADVCFTPFWSTSAVTYFAQAIADAAGTHTGPYYTVFTDFGNGDQYEIDNTPAQASNLVAGTAHTNHTLHWPGDQDYMWFTNAARCLYYATFTNNTIGGDLRVYDSLGILRADDIIGSGDGEAYAFLPMAGTNYISVAAASIWSMTSTYDMLVENLGTPADPDPYEVDDAPALASNITAGVTQTDHTIHHAADFDYLTLTALANHYYRVDVNNLAATLDAVLVLYDATGTNQLDYSDVGDETISSFYTANSTNYILVKNYYNAVTDTGSYDVALTDLGFYPPDQYEIDNSADTASNIVVNVPQTTRNIHWAGDRDYLKCIAQDYHAYQFSVTSVGASLNARLALLAADGSTTLASANTGGAGANETLSYVFTSAGTNYLMVSNSASMMTDTGAYQIAVTDLGAITADPYEPDNSVAAASNIVVDAAQTNRTLHLTNDVDFVKVALQSNRYYRFETYNRQCALAADLRLLGTNGVDLLAQQSNSLDYRILTDGDYFLRVAVYSNLTAGSYTLRVRDLRIRYKWNVGGGICSPAAGPNDRIYLGRDLFYALLPDGTGTQTWNAAGNGWFYSAPTVDTNGLVFMASTNRFNVFSTNGTTNGTAYLGFEIWYSSPALGPDGSVYMTATNKLYSLNTLAQTNWFSTATGLIYSSPAVDAAGNIYYSSTDRHLRKLSQANTTNWDVHLGQALYSSPAIDASGNLVVAGATGTVFLVSATNGSILRTWQAGTNFNRGNSPVIGYDGTIYIGNSNGFVYALQPDGTVGPIWTTTNYINTTPAIGLDGTIYVSSHDGNCYAFNPDGTTGFVWTVGQEMWASPTIATNGIIYQNHQGYLYSLYSLSWPTGGLALSAWPMLSHDERHTGQAGPIAPAGVSAGDGSSSDYIAVTWMAASNAASYEVWRNIISSPGSATLIGQPASTNYLDTNAVYCQIYYYWIRPRSARAAGGLSSYDTGWRTLPPPTGVSASDGTFTDRVAVSWSATTGAVLYTVWRSVDTNSASAANISSTAATNYDDFSIEANITNYYRVTARGANGSNSAFSLPDAGWRCSTNPPVPEPTNTIAPPASVAASAGVYRDKIYVSWAVVTNATAYELWRNTANNSNSSAKLTDVAGGLGYSDTSAMRGALYYYWLKAKNAAVTSEFSAPACGCCSSLSGGLAGDYDGDGKADPTLYDEATGTWYTLLSGAGYAKLELPGFLGGPGYVPVAADYDADRLTDPAVYGITNGDWIVLLSGMNYQRLELPGYLGGTGFSPAPGDFDGDHLADPGVYGEAAGDWLMMLSTAANQGGYDKRRLITRG